MDSRTRMAGRAPYTAERNQPEALRQPGGLHLVLAAFMRRRVRLPWLLVTFSFRSFMHRARAWIHASGQSHGDGVLPRFIELDHSIPLFQWPLPGHQDLKLCVRRAWAE